MNKPYLSIARIERRLGTGNTEGISFRPGVNVLVGRPNTGKTKWLQTLDYLLGDPDENPFENAAEEGLAEKYDAAAAELLIGGELVRIERRWREPGNKTKVFVNDEGMPARDFQHWLMERLGIPRVSFPKGNPMSGQTWPELSFRMLLRHIYRQQRFWSGIADQQPEAEQHACVLQFLGLAESIFTEDYGELVRLRREAEQTKLRREQYIRTLDELAQDLVGTEEQSVGVSEATVRLAGERIRDEIGQLLTDRTRVLNAAKDSVLPSSQRNHVVVLAETRARIVVNLEELEQKERAARERLGELRRYRTDLSDELERLSRAEDAGSVLSDLKVTHCPACDQAVAEAKADHDHCFLCHQVLPDQPLLAELGTVRLRFERERLSGELAEADELVAIVSRDADARATDAARQKEHLRRLDNELAPSRQAIGALAQEEISAIDMALGRASERQRQLSRIAASLELASQMDEKIRLIEQQIEPLARKVDEALRAADFDGAASRLADGMNAYLTGLNSTRPNVWLHNPLAVDLSRWSFNIRVGSRKWTSALGGTDRLYLLMAYHFGLLSLSPWQGSHYPGLTVIDVPGEFSGEAIGDKENFIVQPFIELLKAPEFEGCQVILTGASFAGLTGAHRIELNHVYVS